MPLFDFLHAVGDYGRGRGDAYLANRDKLILRVADVIGRTYDLGFTAFGGPAVHFKILHARFVEGRKGKTPWIDEQIVRAFSDLKRCWPYAANGWTGPVSRTICHMSSFARAWQHKDGLLYGSDTRRVSTRSACLFDMEVITPRPILP